MVEHERYMHTHRHVKPYKCSYCDYRCNLSGNCRKHIANRHPGQPIVWVRVCEKWDDTGASAEPPPTAASQAASTDFKADVGKKAAMVPSMLPSSQSSLTELRPASTASELVESQLLLAATSQGTTVSQQQLLEDVVMNLTCYQNKQPPPAATPTTKQQQEQAAQAGKLVVPIPANPIMAHHPPHPQHPPQPSHVNPIAHYYPNDALGLSFFMGMEGAQQSYVSSLQYNPPMSSGNHEAPHYRN